MREHNLSKYKVFYDLNNIVRLKIGEEAYISFRPHLERRCWSLAFYGLPDLHCSDFVEDLV